MGFESYKDVLSFAIQEEQRVSDLYRLYGRIVRNRATKRLLTELSEQELSNKKMLEEVLESGEMGETKTKNGRNGISMSDFFASCPVSPHSSPQNVMQFAMKIEAMAYRLYRGLHENYEGTELEVVFGKLAEEELCHRTMLEKEYEEHFMRWM